MASVLAVCVCVVALFALTSAEHVQDEADQEQGFGLGLKLVLRVIESCEKHKDTSKCLKLKALKFVDRAISTEEISVMDGVSLVQTGDVVNDSRSVGDEGKGTPDVEDMLVDRVARFFGSHALQINVNKLADGKLKEVGEFLQEGRGKKMKKLMGPLVLGVMWKAGMLALAFKGIALMAGKALLVANVALVLAAVLGLKSLVSSQHHEKVTYEVVKSPQVSHGYVQAASNPVPSTSAWESSGGYDTAGKGGHYRSMDVSGAESSPQAFVYHAQIPAHVQHIVVPRPTGTTQVLVGARSAQ